VRVLGLDYGGRTIGVAISDPFLITAFGLETIRRPDEASVKKSVARLGEIIKEYGVKTIVLGYPKHLNNTESARGALTVSFKERLERNFKGVEIILWDERFTSAAAYKELSAAGASGRQIKAVNDQTAAVLILQNYLEYIKREK